MREARGDEGEGGKEEEGRLREERGQNPRMAWTMREEEGEDVGMELVVGEVSEGIEKTSPMASSGKRASPEGVVTFVICGRQSGE